MQEDGEERRELKRKKKKGEEHILPASEAAENRLQQGEKNKSAKNTTSSSISHPPSLHPSYQDAHTHTHTICFYQHTLARALKPAELRKFRSGRRVGREVTAECPIVDEEGLTWTPETVHVCECARVFVCNLWLNLTYYFKNPLPLSPLSTALCVTPLHPPLLRLSHHPHTSALADGYIHAQFHRRAQSCFYL